MRLKILLLLIGGLIFLSFLIARQRAYAEEVTGCPLGLRKGELWINEKFSYSEAEEYFDPQSKKMKDLPKEWKQEIWGLNTRIGYGITDRFEVGLLLPYKHVNMRKQKKGKWISVNDGGIGDIWLAAAYKFIDNPEEGFIEAAKIGIGVKFDVGSDELVKKDIGNGAKAVRIVLLSHDRLMGEKVELCNHIYYEWNGEARKIKDWEKSKWDYGDKIGYNFLVEYAFTPYVRLAFGPIGWAEISKTEKADGSEAHPKFYNHMFHLLLEYLPTGEERDHKKAAIGINIPYKVKNGFAPDYEIMGVFMWTF